MTVCQIYSGWLRTWEQCKANHTEKLHPQADYTVHYNETTPFAHEPFTEDIWGYYANKAPENQTWNTMNMWRAMYTAWQKAPEGFDCYVRNRYDIVFEGDINFDQFQMRDDVVYIPMGSDYRDGVNDQFAFGSRKAMEAYYSVYLHHGTHFAAGKYFHSESYLKHTLDMLRIGIVRVPVINRIVRG